MDGAYLGNRGYYRPIPLSGLVYFSGARTAARLHTLTASFQTLGLVLALEPWKSPWSKLCWLLRAPECGRFAAAGFDVRCFADPWARGSNEKVFSCIIIAMFFLAWVNQLCNFHPFFFVRDGSNRAHGRSIKRISLLFIITISKHTVILLHSTAPFQASRLCMKEWPKASSLSFLFRKSGC